MNVPVATLALALASPVASSALTDSALRFEDELLPRPPLSLQESLARDPETLRDEHLARRSLHLDQNPPRARASDRERPTMRVIEPDPSVHYSMRVQEPDPSVEYTIREKRVDGPTPTDQPKS